MQSRNEAHNVYVRSVIPVHVHNYIQDEGDVFVYEATASGVDGSTFTAHIRVPGRPVHEAASYSNSIYVNV